MFQEIFVEPRKLKLLNSIMEREDCEKKWDKNELDVINKIENEKNQTIK